MRVVSRAGVSRSSASSRSRRRPTRDSKATKGSHSLALLALEARRRWRSRRRSRSGARTRAEACGAVSVPFASPSVRGSALPGGQGHEDLRRARPRPPRARPTAPESYCAPRAPRARGVARGFVGFLGSRHEGRFRCRPHRLLAHAGEAGVRGPGGKRELRRRIPKGFWPLDHALDSRSSCDRQAMLRPAL